MPVNLPTNLLRSFVSIVDAGSMVSASEQVFVTQSALSLQIKRLEGLLRKTLFHRDGRRLTLTPHGSVMLSYARRVLALHDEGVMAVTTGTSTGPARIGMVQDFAEHLLSDILARFAKLDPDVAVQPRVASTAELLSLLDQRQLDLVLGFGDDRCNQAVNSVPMQWLGNEELALLEVIPLVTLGPPCVFHAAALRALETTGRPYRIVFEASDLTSLRAAVQAGIGLTCRTSHFIAHGEVRSGVLPALPAVGCILHTAKDNFASHGRLAFLAREAIDEALSDSRRVLREH